MTISNKLYNILKWVSLVGLPAISALYFGIAQIWGLPYSEQIVGTIAIIETFIGTLIGITSANYKGDGTLMVDTTREDKDVVRLDFNVDPTTVGDRRTFVLRVDPKAEIEEIKPKT